MRSQPAAGSGRGYEIGGATYQPDPARPIQKFLQRRVQREFIDSGSNGRAEFRIFVSVAMSPDGSAEMIEKLRRLAKEMREKNGKLESLPLQKRCGTSLMIAIWPWQIDIFWHLCRDAYKPKP